MRQLWSILILLALFLAPLRAATDEELAGENDLTPTPAVKPTSEAPDENAPISLSPSSSGAQKPSFELPTFVITGGGEHKAVAARQSLSPWMDTSGGIKASPSDSGASKSQVGAQAQRQTFEDLTQTSIPSYGQLHLLYGLQNTLEAGAFYGQEIGPFFYLLQGEHDSSDGGPSDVPVHTLDQNDQSELAARGGWREGDGSQWGVDLDARQRDRFFTFSELPNPLISRSLDRESMSWDSPNNAGTRLDLRLDADQGTVLLPGQGTVYEEDGVKLVGNVESEVLTRESRTLLELNFYAGQLDQDRGAQASYPAGGRFMARFDMWSGAKLGLGLSFDSYSGGLSAYSLAPQAEFEQSLGAGWGLWLRFDPGLEVPTLADGLFEEDPALPNLQSLPSRDSVNLEGGISAALPRELNLELKGSIRQNDNANFLDDQGQEGLWTETTLEGSQTVNASLNESMPLGLGFSERAQAGWSTLSLTDSPGLEATFSPSLEGEAYLDWASGPWKASGGGRYLGTRVADLQGDENLPAYFDLRLKASYALSDDCRLLAEARNLLAQTVEEFPGYADPAPFAGLGVELSF